MDFQSVLISDIVQPCAGDELHITVDDSGWMYKSQQVDIVGVGRYVVIESDETSKVVLVAVTLQPGAPPGSVIQARSTIVAADRSCCDSSSSLSSSLSSEDSWSDSSSASYCAGAAAGPANGTVGPPGDDCCDPPFRVRDTEDAAFWLVVQPDTEEIHGATRTGLCDRAFERFVQTNRHGQSSPRNLCEVAIFTGTSPRTCKWLYETEPGVKFVAKSRFEDDPESGGSILRLDLVYAEKNVQFMCQNDNATFTWLLRNTDGCITSQTFNLTNCDIARQFPALCIILKRANVSVEDVTLTMKGRVNQGRLDILVGVPANASVPSLRIVFQLGSRLQVAKRAANNTVTYADTCI